MRTLFGSAGSPERFFAEGNKASIQMPGWLEENFLDVFEYQCGNGVVIREPTARAIGRKAAEHHITMTLHAPYYVSPANPDPAVREKTFGHILKAARAASWIGSSRIVVHAGSVGRLTRAEAVAESSKNFLEARKILDEEHLDDILICPETLGKVQQIGELSEILEICSGHERLLPCVDFGHLYARSHGGVTTEEDFGRLLDEMLNTLGRERVQRFHVHFSRIAYTAGGEKNHLTFADTEYGPDFRPFAVALIRRRLTPVIICESAGTQADDAFIMKKIYSECLEQFG